MSDNNQVSNPDDLKPTGQNDGAAPELKTGVKAGPDIVVEQ